MNALRLTRLTPGSSAEDRRDFAECFNATLDQLEIRPGKPFVIAAPNGEAPPRAGHCRHCGEPVDPERAWRRESGYVKPRAQGGTNALAIREEHLDDLACDQCISRLKRGVSPAQESLI